MNKSERSTWKSLQYGCVSGVISTIICQPLDVMKTRLQTKVVFGLPPLGIVQAMGQVYSTNSTITGGSTSLPRVVQVCGRLGNFWTGTYPSLWRCVPGVGAYFMCLNALQDVTDRWNILTPTTAYTPKTAVKSFMLAFTARVS
uniref:Mitochondrial carrier protein n=1 Tax=Trichobilharzia regenti TaxID=157069 RepID=A0AA85ISW6_TRIRE|nr:unnamed protein product [Trichobilharzia regenti]